MKLEKLESAIQKLVSTFIDNNTLSDFDIEVQNWYETEEVNEENCIQHIHFGSGSLINCEKKVIYCKIKIKCEEQKK